LRRGRRGGAGPGGSAQRRTWEREIASSSTADAAEQTQNAKSYDNTDEIRLLRSHYLAASPQSSVSAVLREHLPSCLLRSYYLIASTQILVRCCCCCLLFLLFASSPLLISFSSCAFHSSPAVPPLAPVYFFLGWPPNFIGWSRKGSPARSGGLPFLESPGVERNLGQGWGRGLLISWDQPIEINR